MKKIAFIMKGSLPVPAINGGAVEVLVDSLLSSNKVNGKYKIDVYSAKCNKIKNNYSHGNINYYYIEEKFFFEKIEKIIRFIINKASKKYIGNIYISKIIRKYKDKFYEYDYVIVENRAEYGLVLKKYINGKLIFHSHNEFINNKRINEIAECYDKFFIVSKFMCDRAKTIPNIDEKKIKLLYNGVNIEKFNIVIDKNEERKKWGLSEDDIVFLYTGRLVKVKGIMELIEAFNNIKNAKYKLLIVGSISYGKTKTNEFTENLKKISYNNSNIIFTGFLNYSDIQKIYKISDYGMIPSIWEEPFALTVIEHLASGHPVIITKSGGMPELVNEKCAITIEKDKNIIENLTKKMKNIVKRNFNSKDCIEQAKKFSDEKYIDRFLELLEED